MSATFDQVRSLVRVGRFVVSQHGTRRLLSRGIGLDDIVAGLQTAEVIEDYPQYFAGPAVLVLFFDASGGSLHALWGLRKGTSEPAVLITAYRPDPSQWSTDLRTRRS